MIGVSPGNGHPFSFSAIINGYSDTGMSESGWDTIHQYLRKQDRSDIGLDEVMVTHAWTQDPNVTKRLCQACLIPNAVSSPVDMIGKVDVVIIARDDYELHTQQALPFLEEGLPVFVDKPLTLSAEEMGILEPYLRSGLLCSGSAMRFARELDDIRADLATFGKIKLIRGAVVNSWEKYGIHLIDALFGITDARPLRVRPLFGRDHTSLAIELSDGVLVEIDALGNVPKTFTMDIWGTERRATVEITDNFTMFRRMLMRFFKFLDGAPSPFPPGDTIKGMRLLIAGRQAIAEDREVFVDDV